MTKIRFDITGSAVMKLSRYRYLIPKGVPLWNYLGIDVWYQMDCHYEMILVYMFDIKGCAIMKLSGYRCLLSKGWPSWNYLNVWYQRECPHLGYLGIAVIKLSRYRCMISKGVPSWNYLGIDVWHQREGRYQNYLGIDVWYQRVCHQEII